MGQGLRVWDEYGNLTVDSDFRMSRKLGQLYVKNSGSLVVPEFSEGTPWVYTVVDWSNMFKEIKNKQMNYENYAIPKINGTTLEWMWTRGDFIRWNYATWIIYGVY